MAERPQKVDPFLMVYFAALKTVFGLWFEMSKPISDGLAKGINPPALTPDVDYLEHVRRAAESMSVPPGGEALQRAMLNMMQMQLIQYRAILAGDLVGGNQYEGPIAQEFAVYSAEIDALSQRAEHYAY